MAAIGGWLEGFLHGPAALWVVLLVSLLLGLRHASDPDHLAAVTTLIASDRDGGGMRKAGSMGLSWGLGHGTALIVIGLPLVLLGRYLPEPVQQAAETMIGVIIVLLAVRLLMRRRWGYFHAHVHSHDGELVHGHVHSHESEPTHEHISLDRLGFGMVLVVAFSAGLAIVLTVVGLLMVYARKLFEKYSLEARVPRFVPVASAAVITMAGVGIALAALEQAGIV